MTNASTAVQPSKLPFSRVLAAGGIAIVGSVIANVIVYYLGVMLTQPPADFLPLDSPMRTVIFTVLNLVVATIVFAVINAFSKSPIRLFTIVAVVALLLGLIPDIMLLVNPAAMAMGTPTFGAVLVLIVMHFVGFAITIWAFTRWAPKA